MNAQLFTIPFEAEDLSAIRKAVDDAVKYREAKAVEAAAGRTKALQALAGKSVMRDPMCPDSLRSVVKRMPLGTRKKKGQPSNWPSKKEDREKVRKRTEQRRANGLASPFVEGRLSSDGKVYIPSLREAKTLKRVSARIAEHLAIDPSELSVPKAVVSCVEPSDFIQRHRQSGTCIQLAIRHGTKKIHVIESQTIPIADADMNCGDVFAFSGTEAHRMPPTAWQRDLFFTAHKTAM